MIPKSEGHVAFATKRPDDKGRSYYRKAPPEDAQVEFWVDDTGTALTRAPIDAAMVGGRRLGTMVATGLFLLRDVFAQLGVPAPASTQREIDKRAAALAALTATNQELTGSSPVQPKGRQSMKGKHSKVSMIETWALLFKRNHDAPKKGKLTDDQLVKEMEREFPESKGKSTVTRVSMFRACYNAGTHMFKKFPKAGGKDRPIAVAYDSDGEEIAGRKSGKAKVEPKKGKAKAAAKPKKSERSEPKKKKGKAAAPAGPDPDLDVAGSDPDLDPAASPEEAADSQ